METLTPSQKGAAAEAAITAAVIQLGLTVLRPLCEGRRYDLIVDLEPRLLRVQCKLAKRVGGALAIRLQTSRYTPGGYVFTSYSADEIDAVGAYSAELKRCFLLPIAVVENMRGIHLRLDPSGNNQARGVRWANDYELEPMIRRLRTAGRPPDSLLVARWHQVGSRPRTGTVVQDLRANQTRRSLAGQLHFPDQIEGL